MIEETFIKRYLLGQLSSEERQKFENEYFSDTKTFEAVVAIENDLIDSYARTELRGPEKLLFEQRYCSSPEGRSRIQFSMALTEIVRSSQSTVKSKKFRFGELFRLPFEFAGQSFQWALGTVCIVLCVAVFLLTFRNRELNRELLNARNNETALRTERDEAVGQIASLSQTPKGEPANPLARSDVRELAFTLAAGIVRGESQGQILVVPRDRPWIRLEMPIDEDAFKGYEAVLYTPEMHELRRGQSLKSQSTANGIRIDWRIPSESLQSGDYVLQLNGKQDGGEAEPLTVFSFRVIHK
jgi:hypothetical protein